MTVIGREHEYKLIHQKINKFIGDNINSLVYISGVPGSGKTYTLTKVLEDVKLPFTYVNVGKIKFKSHIYKEVYNSLKCEKQKTKHYLVALRDHLMTCVSPHIIIIDEIDLLIDRAQSFIYNLTDLINLQNTNILLIYISNTLNLPERQLESKIKSRFGLNKIDFNPYTHTKLKKIICSKYENVDNLDIELVTRRVAAVHGDIRKAINLIETPQKINEIFIPLHYKILPFLSRHQKFLLHVICNLKDNVNTDKIYRNFESFCKIHDFAVLDFYEFINLIEKLRDFGIVRYRSYNDKTILLLDAEEISNVFTNDSDFNFLTSSKINTCTKKAL